MAGQGWGGAREIGRPSAKRPRALMVAARAQVDQYVAVVAFVYFGVKLLRDSYRAPAG
jgi:hypothetical protein